MKAKHKQSGISLMEQTMVIAAVGLLIYLAMPSAKHLFNTMHTPAGTKAMISSALASARAIAAKEQRYAGIRFQHAYYKDEPKESPLKMPQYMIFIMYHPPRELDSQQTAANLFTAVEGIEPIKLPENIGVMDFYVNQDAYDRISDTELDSEEGINDATTFSILFSPAGKLIVRQVQTRNRDGDVSDNDSEDDIFNTEDRVEDGFAMFIQDYGLNTPSKNILEIEKEPSRRAFIIYDRNIFRSLDKDNRYTDYIEDFVEEKAGKSMVYINQYTGRIIER